MFQSLIDLMFDIKFYFLVVTIVISEKVEALI